jgi:hypothetical protein
MGQLGAEKVPCTPFQTPCSAHSRARTLSDHAGSSEQLDLTATQGDLEQPERAATLPERERDRPFEIKPEAPANRQPS